MCKINYTTSTYSSPAHAHHMSSKIFLFQLFLCLLYSVANDDQYATNVPDTCYEDSHGNVESRDQPASRESEGAVEPNGGGKDPEVVYLAQMRRPQFSICGSYKSSNVLPRNHFYSYSDVKKRGE